MSGGQILEGVVLYLDDGRVHHVSPTGSASFYFGWDPDLLPGEVVVDGVATLGLSPFLVHSTSWRLHEGRIVLTYIVCVDRPVQVDPSLRDEVVDRSDLARGHMMGPPIEVEPHHVVEHGLRHLAWLIGDDQALGDALPEWAEALADYQPEPFRAFGGSVRR
jgi:hypothetical protein